MSVEKSRGSCLCAAVKYEVSPPYHRFQYCHCSKCRKFTGSAHASNILVAPQNFRWTHGEEHLGRYEDPHSEHFATCFCKVCGSSLPWLAQQGTVVVVPAGTLDDAPAVTPSRNIFWGSRASWYADPSALPCFDDLPVGKPSTR
jgi:hypothetical protein